MLIEDILTGKGYKNWKLVSETKPNYWYWKFGNMYVENRIKYQKHKLKNILENYNDSLSEFENMYNNNYRWIWDCGNLKFKYSTGE